MKCINCRGELRPDGQKFVCDYCGSSFLKEELFPSKTQGGGFEIVGGVLLSYTGNEPEVAIPVGTLSVGKEAFKNNLTVKKVVFSETLTSIEESAFEGCGNLREIENFENIVSFSDGCFRFSGLEDVEIGAAVRHLGKGCFSRMPNLKYVYYSPEKDLKLNHTFAFCPMLAEVETGETGRFYFFPSFHTSLELLNNPGNTRPTFADAFAGTPYIEAVKVAYLKSYKQGVCPECGGKIKKCLLHAKCKNCKIDYKN